MRVYLSGVATLANNHQKKIFMTTKQLLQFIFVAIIFMACKKDNEKIDVSNQWLTDVNGNLIKGYSDGQWENRTFTTQELSLFKILDTTSLAGTTKSDSLIFSPIYPNPFKSTMVMYVGFSFRYSGQSLLKFVIVDDLMHAVKTGSVMLKAASPPPLYYPPSFLFAILSDFPIGKYRLYFTVSASSNENFYKSSGNIEKIQ